MADTAVATTNGQEVSWQTLEKVLSTGDLGDLTPKQRTELYISTCESLGLNYRTMPFRFIKFPQGGTQLYAQRGAADQLRKVNGLSLVKLETQFANDLVMVTARYRDRDGREDEDVGAVFVGNLRGLELANAIKKAVTQAKRRATLSMCGLGFLDESETDDVPRATTTAVDLATGEIIEQVGQPVQAPAMDLATERQLKAVYAIGRAAHLSDAEIVDQCRAKFNTEPERLLRREAGEFIDHLKQEMNKPRQEAEQETPKPQPTRITPAPGSHGERVSNEAYSRFWSHVISAGWKRPDVVKGAVDLTGVPVERMSVAQLNGYQEALLSGRMALDGDGKWILTPMPMPGVEPLDSLEDVAWEATAPETVAAK